MLSVVIPTHRRPAILRQCLEHLERQTIAADIEAIVVSDGPDTATRSIVEAAQWRIPVRYFEIPKAQQGASRNRGVREARGSIVLFIGDDIFLEEGTCAAHRDAHAVGARHAVLGYTTWDPAVGITFVMRWLERSGWQFDYGTLADYGGGDVPPSVQHRFTYTSNISLPAAAARQVPFREDVSLYGWEDVEWGMRLRETGMPLIFNPLARALHHHHLSYEDSLRRMETLGRSAVEIARAVQAFDRVPRGWKRRAYRIAALMPTLAGRHRAAFLRGIMAAEKS